MFRYIVTLLPFPNSDTISDFTEFTVNKFDRTVLLILHVAAGNICASNLSTIKVGNEFTPVDCLPMALRSVPQVVDGDKENREADKRTGDNDNAQHDLDLGCGEGWQGGQGHVLSRRHFLSFELLSDIETPWSSH